MTEQIGDHLLIHSAKKVGEVQGSLLGLAIHLALALSLLALRVGLWLGRLVLRLAFGQPRRDRGKLEGQ